MYASLIRLIVCVSLYSEKSEESEESEVKEEIVKAEVRVEIERYIVWPAQATSYKMGMLKILELRQKANDALGDKFDIRKFHTIVLDQGIVPLFVLEDIIDEWIESYGL